MGAGRGRAEGGEDREEEALYCAVLCCTVPLAQRKRASGQGTSGGTITIAGGQWYGPSFRHWCKRAACSAAHVESAQIMHHSPPPGSGDLRRESGPGSKKVGSVQKQKLVEASGRVSAGHSCPVAPLSPTPARAPAGKTQGSGFFKYSAVITGNHYVQYCVH